MCVCVLGGWGNFGSRKDGRPDEQLVLVYLGLGQGPEQVVERAGVPRVPPGGGQVRARHGGLPRRRVQEAEGSRPRPVRHLRRPPRRSGPLLLEAASLRQHPPRGNCRLAPAYYCFGHYCFWSSAFVRLFDWCCVPAKLAS